MREFIVGQAARLRRLFSEEKGLETLEYIGMAAVVVAFVGVLLFTLGGGGGARIGSAISQVMAQWAVSFESGSGGSGVPSEGAPSVGAPGAGEASSGRPQTGPPAYAEPATGVPSAVSMLLNPSGAEAGFDWRSLLAVGKVYDDLVKGKPGAGGAGAVSVVLDVASNLLAGETRDFVKGGAQLIRSAKLAADAVDKLAGWGNAQNSSTAFSALKWTRWQKWTKPFGRFAARHTWLVRVGGALSVLGGGLTFFSGVNELRRREYVDGFADVGSGIAMVALGLAGMGVITLSAPVTAIALGGLAVFTAIRYRREIGTFLKKSASVVKSVANEALNGIKSAFKGALGLP